MEVPEQMHVLLYTDDPGVGGVAQYNHTVLSALRARGYQATTVQSQRNNPLIQEQAAIGVKHEWLPFDSMSEFGRTFVDVNTAHAIFAKTQPDVILFSDACPVSNFAAKQAALQLGIPYVIVIGFVAGSLDYHFAPDIDTTAILDALAVQFDRARAVIAVSQENLNLLYQIYRLPAHQGQVIHYGRPSRYFTPQNPVMRDRLRQEVGIPAEGVVCFTAARLETIKGYQYQLEAIAHLKQTSTWFNLYFVWAGEGTLLADLKQAIAELDVTDRVRLLGQRWDVVDWYDAADVFVFPSELEGMPLAIMEAMAKGLPVVASAVSGIPEELGDTGKLLPNPNHDPWGTVGALIETLQEWVSDRPLRQTIGQAGQRRAQQMFQEHRMVSETLMVLQRALLPVGRDHFSPKTGVC